ncbi:formimidoylglutamate deiminase [uncultured Microbacterium sp.]|uniref:Atrazine chlorohydrolase n=1 Tax=uncultured Microbacterium sp. TaxID=191216 RepID=A0A1Y5NZA4_9MICO|nr:formimidoylglutamate deiminase [uncultured Microbacterium sp.]SBS71726.1 Atrazine chlorohydrolase [uncultured Microbacterium sp.]
MTVFWCERAIVDGRVEDAVRISVVDGVIHSVDVRAAASGTDEILPGLILAGLANAHSHAFHRALRGRTHGDGGTFWTWRTAMYDVATRLSPDSYRRLATAVFAEMVLAGFTLVGEFHYIHGRPDGTPYGDAAMERAILAAAADAGIRLTLLDTLYLRGGLAEDGSALPLATDQRRFSDGSVEAWGRRRALVSSTATAIVGAAVHSVRAVAPADLREFRERTRGLPVHAHVSEQPAENAQVLAETGRTPMRVLADADLIDPSFTAVHATHVSAEDIDALARPAAFACFCPTTERDLADGIGPARRLADAGVRLTLGSDQHVALDPFEEARGIEMNERLASGQRGRFDPAELLVMAGQDGYRSLGWTGGRLVVGSVCDLVAVDPGSPRTAGSRSDQVWLSASASDVTDVVVHGRRVVTARKHRLGDVGTLLAEAIAEVWA